MWRREVSMQEQRGSAGYEAHVSKRKMWAVVALALAFAAVGLWLVSAAEAFSQSVRFVFFRDPFILRAFGVVALVFGIVGAIIAFRQLFRTGPVIEVDGRGVRWARWSETIIPWSAITDASSKSMSGQHFLCLTLARPSDYPGRSTARMMAGLNKGLGYSDIAISANGTDSSHDELMVAVSRFRPFIG